MDNSEKVNRTANPREKANLLSLLTFGYTGKLFRQSWKKDLEEDDIYEVMRVCGSKKCGNKLENEWKRLREAKGKNDPSIVRLLWNCFGVRYVLLGLVHLVWKCANTYLEPEAIGKLVAYFNPNQTQLTIYHAFYYASIMLGFKFIHCFYFQNYIIYLQQLAVQIRASFCSLIYRKSLRLTPTAMNEISLGNIITVMTKDVLSFEQCIWLFNDMWIEIIRSILVCFLIYNKMGLASVYGIGILFTVIPVQVYAGKIIKNWRLRVNAKTDDRLQNTQEALSAIKIIKMYTWERFFSKQISESRRKEMKLVMRSSLLKSMNMLTGILTSKIGFYVLIMAYIYLNDVTSAETIFYVMKCFKNLKHSIGMLIPIGLGRGAELYASTTRINTILKAPELEPDDDKIIEKPKVNIKNGSVKIKDKSVLHNVNVDLKNGLTVVTGPLGCGKSSLLKVFLKDYPLDDGNLTSDGSKSYTSQDPWVFPSSIKQNILFGQEYNEKRYKEVIDVCALEYDFSLLDRGDETIVADKGLNLSKGQQARINLARAVYKESDIYLLDDPLNALDPKVQDSVFNDCVQGFLRGKICVLVTHNQKHINDADQIVILENGGIKYQGKPEVSIKILNDINKKEKEIYKEDALEESEETDEKSMLLRKRGPGRKVYSEIKQKGSVNMKVYKKYFQFGGGFITFIAIFAMFITSEFTDSYSQKLLTNWINVQQNVTNLKEKNTTDDNVYEDIQNDASSILNLYSIMIGSSIIVDLMKQYLFLNFVRKASIKLHESMINTLMHAVMSFYDNYFIGNILNRFSQDLSIVDEHLPHTLNMFVMVLFSISGMFILVMTVNWTFFIPATVLVLFLSVARHLYMPASRSLKRLESATRSPLIGHLNASMDGITTIRAYKAQQILGDEFDRHQDLYTSTYYTSFCIRRAFAFFMDMAAAIFLTVIVASFLFWNTNQSAGNVGLAITQAAALASVVQWALMQWSDVENNMTSVERVLEYTELPQENYQGQTLENWPVNGTVVFEHVSLTYLNAERVLKDVNFSVGAQEKIGIVGRTGAGKSSIMSTLFRLYNFDGSVFIDGVNTKTLSLEFLRDHISIIPQDPVLFRGTIRSNIDPLHKYTDEEIWQVIEKVKMKESIPSLSIKITDHGSNFSTGQRQLLCLARAIIRKNKVVVLDEATANMDPQTEHLIQKTIVENFSFCTVFIIAHRLQSVLDCNKVMVLEKGEVMEFDDPVVLMQNKNGFFASMLENCDNIGISE